MHIIHRVLVYLFPAILLAFEWLLMTAGSINISPAIGPSFAAGSLGLLVPLTTPKIREPELPAEDLDKLKAKNLTVVGKKDTALSSLCLLLLLVFLCVWGYVAYISVTGQIPALFGKDWQWDIIIGVSTYVIAASLAEAKEAF